LVWYFIDLFVVVFALNCSLIGSELIFRFLFAYLGLVLTWSLFNIFWFDTYFICFCCCCFELFVHRKWVNDSMLFVIWIYFGLILTWSLFVVVALNYAHKVCELIFIWVYNLNTLRFDTYLIRFCCCLHMQDVSYSFHFVCNLNIFWFDTYFVFALNCSLIGSELIFHFCCIFGFDTNLIPFYWLPKGKCTAYCMQLYHCYYSQMLT